MNFNSKNQPHIFVIYQPNDNIFIQSQSKYYFINIHKSFIVYIYESNDNFVYNKSPNTDTVNQLLPEIYISIEPPIDISSVPVKQSTQNSLFKDILLHIIDYCREQNKIDHLKEYLNYYTVRIPTF